VITFFRVHFEKFLAGLGVAGLAASAVWTWAERPRAHSIRPLVSHPAGGGAETRLEREQDSDGDATWNAPGTQPHGSGWVYEIFTPPVIYYDATAKSFAVASPSLVPSTAPSSEEIATAVELLDVKPAPYRLQLVGYFLAAGGYTGIFSRPDSGETILARAGRRFPDLGLELRDLTVTKVEVGRRAAQPIFDVAALALLHDAQADADVTLDSRARRFTNIPLAVIRNRAGGGKAQEMRTGDEFQSKRETYRIEQIQLDPAEVRVAWVTAGGIEPQTCILRPSFGAGDEPDDAEGPDRDTPGSREAGLVSVDSAK
jgi:hypothetical protein